MQLAPIVIFSYNRPIHLQRVLEALSKNKLASESVLYIYCDGAKEGATEDQIDKVVQNKKVAYSSIGFKAVHVVERPYNFGLADNIIGAVTEIVNRYGRVITLEDDVITAPCFLQYMNEALELYANDERVMHITGFMWHHRWPMPVTFFHPVPECGGGWATWQRAWKYFNNNVQELYDYWKNDWTRFNTFGGTIIQDQLEANLNGTLKTWFVKWHAVVLQRNGLTLYPGRSLTTNIGFDGTGTNCFALESNPFYYSKLPNNIQIRRIPVKESKMARYQIYCAQQGRFYSKRNRKHLIDYFRQLIAHMK